MTSPITGTFDDVKGHDGSLIRKMLELAVFVADEDAPEISTIIDPTDNSLVIPDGYTSLGIMSKEQGAAITPSLEMSEVTGYGYGQPLSRDVVSRGVDLGFTMLESKRKTFEVYHGIDLSAVVAPAQGAGNEISYDQADRPDTKYWRVLCLGRQNQGAKSIYHAEWFPRMTLTDVSEQTWSETDPLSYAVTLSADLDSAVGTSQRTFWAGPGFDTALITAMGFTRATGA